MPKGSRLVIVVLAGLFFIHAGLSGRWAALHRNMGFAALMFAAMRWLYAQILMGGGDLKLITVAFLWSGLYCSVPLLVILTVLALLHNLSATFRWVCAQHVNGRIRGPLAPSVPSGCLAPM